MHDRLLIPEAAIASAVTPLANTLLRFRRARFRNFGFATMSR
jgi:hypothetical protein